MTTQPTIGQFHQTPEDVARLNQWMFDVVKPYVTKRVLDISGGSGLLSSLFVEQETLIHLNATDEDNRAYLKERFKSYPNVQGVHKIDFHRSDLEFAYSNFAQAFHTLVAINISEYGYIDQTALLKATSLLRKHGNLIIALPSYTAMFPGTDYAIDDLKQSDRKSLQEVLGNFEILKIRHFNWTCLSFIAVAAKR